MTRSMIIKMIIIKIIIKEDRFIVTIIIIATITIETINYDPATKTCFND